MSLSSLWSLVEEVLRGLYTILCFYYERTGILGLIGGVCLLLVVEKLRGRRFHSLARLLTIIVNTFGTSSLTLFSMEEMTLFPFYMRRIRLETKRMRSQPKVLVEIDEVKMARCTHILLTF